MAGTTIANDPYALRVNAGLIGAAVGLCAYSLVMVYSATHGRATLAAYFPKQVGFVIVGLILVFGISLIDYSRLQHYFPQLYALNIVSLLSVFLLGRSVKGAQRWIDLVVFRFQPSELAKLLAILTLAAYIVYRKGDMDSPAEVARSFALMLPPMLLIMRQPDLGTALVIGAIWFGMLFVAGVRWQYLVATALIVLVVGVGAWQLHILSDYQVDRLVVFVDPGVDPSGAGYNLKQSKIAIGSGGMWGKGLLSGTQTNLNFLPERHTDFIFSVLGEELGFVGGAMLLGLYGWLLLSALRVASAARDQFGGYVAGGIITMWLFQMAVNMGMTTGIMPVTGIPLPFMSYGGSSMWVHLMATGILMSIWLHRHPGAGLAKAEGTRDWGLEGSRAPRT